MIVNGKSESPREIIKRLRNEVMIHSCLYHWFFKPIMRDLRFDEISGELAAFQDAHPHLVDNIGYFDKEFKGYQQFGSSIGLPYDLHEVMVDARIFQNTGIMRKL